MRKNIKWCGRLCCIIFTLNCIQLYADTNPLDTSMSDALIAAKINTQLVANTYTHPYKITITSHNGLVTLSGTVHSITEATQAVQIAESTDGVRDVNAENLELQEAPIKPVSDSYITAKVKGLLIREKLIENRHSSIKIDTRNGMVYLTGTALDQTHANRIISVARSINGVSHVVAKLSLQHKIITFESRQSS